MDQAADEIASSLKRDWAAAGIPDRSQPCGVPRQDIVLAMDMSDSMRSLYGPYHSSSPQKLADSLFQTACDVRVGIVGYGQEDGQGPSLYLAPTSSKADFENSLQKLALTTPEQSFSASTAASLQIKPTDARSGIAAALEQQWRADAQKAVLVITNTSGTGAPSAWDPGVAKNNFAQDPATQAIIRTSREKGGIEIYSGIVPYPSYMNVSIENAGLQPFDYFSVFSEATGGTMLPTTCGTYCYWGDVGMVSFSGKPKLYVPSVTAQVGKPFRIDPIDLSGSIITTAAKSSEMQYEWYVNCGDVTEKAGWSKALEYTFASPGKCTGAVITKAFGRYCYYCGGNFGRSIYRTSVATFELDILPAGYAPPAAPAPLGQVQNLQKSVSGSTVTVTWDPPADTKDIGNVAYAVRSKDGSLIGVLTATTLVIDDVPAGENVDMTITAVSDAATGTPVDIGSIPAAIERPERGIIAMSIEAAANKSAVQSPDTAVQAAVRPANADRFAFPLDDTVYTAVAPRPGTPSGSTIIAPLTSVANVNVKSLEPEARTDSMPTWLLASLAAILTLAGLRAGSIALFSRKKV